MKGMKHLEWMFLEKKFDSDILCTIPNKFCIFLYRKSSFPANAARVKKAHFELTKVLMIINCMNYRINYYFDKQYL